MKENTENQTDQFSANSGLSQWGWNESWAAAWRQGPGPGLGLVPCRVIGQDRHRYRLAGAATAGDQKDGSEGFHPSWEAYGRVSGAFAYRAAGPADFPVPGDWVGVEIPEAGIPADAEAGEEPRLVIQYILPRQGEVSRKVAGEVIQQQVICANLQSLILVFSLDGGRNFVPGFVERAVATAWESGAKPVIVLNKADCADTEYAQRCILEAESAAPGVPVILTSAKTGLGMDTLREELDSARGVSTVSMLGKSGVGKSALINTLRAAEGASGRDRLFPAKEGGLRADFQGRHTTTGKLMYRVGRNLLLDVPGLRELQIWGGSDTVDGGFPEIEALSEYCRFSDCRHQGEPGCAVQGALASGELEYQRFQRYLDMKREVAYIERQVDPKALSANKRFWKQISKEMRGFRKSDRT
ncbi:ribosome small subunit-dependent GTPase A [Spirochaeta lutea]|uniref:ribosome small subunit-dependent GTPase A n=1 Tax=Spirochaeta lutea TaxID=1480694 RepID=UPI0006896AA0|nr:ribosome small subunit-dependent GTPase A [Spirochaeta lutea]